MRAVFPPGLPVLAVGSITPEKINAYWQAGVRGFGLGGSLYRPGDGPAEVAPRVPPFRDAIAMARAEAEQIGRAHGRTPVTNAQLVCRLLLEKKKTRKKQTLKIRRIKTETIKQYKTTPRNVTQLCNLHVQSVTANNLYSNAAIL